jgi:hypothetical protein
MNSVKFFLDINYGDYSSTNASNIEMCNLGYFLASDVRFRPSVFKEYAFNDQQQFMSSNATTLEKQNGYILLRDQYPEEEIPTNLKMSRDQFVKLLDDWEEKVCKLKPKEVLIKYENDEFVIETKD